MWVCKQESDRDSREGRDMVRRLEKGCLIHFIIKTRVIKTQEGLETLSAHSERLVSEYRMLNSVCTHIHTYKGNHSAFKVAAAGGTQCGHVPLGSTRLALQACRPGASGQALPAEIFYDPVFLKVLLVPDTSGAGHTCSTAGARFSESHPSALLCNKNLFSLT